MAFRDRVAATTPQPAAAGAAPANSSNGAAPADAPPLSTHEAFALMLEAAAPMGADGKRTLQLDHEFETHDGPCKVLKFRKPRAGDYMRLVKTPFRGVRAPDGAQTQDVDYALAGKWIEALTGVQATLLELMDGDDFDQAVAVLMGILSGGNVGKR